MNNRRKIKVSSALAGLLIIFSVMALMTVPAFAAQSASATRDIQTQTLAPGDSTTVTVTIANNVSQALSLDEDIPAGWTLTRGVDDADAFNPSTSEWVWFSVAAGATETVTYTLTVAGDATAGDYSISGAISNASGVIDTVKDEDTVTVEVAPTPKSANATREIQTQTLAPSDSTTVTVTIANNVSQALSLDEDIPAGWTLTRGVDDADAFKPSTSEWVWFSVAAGAAKTVTYTLTVASDATAGDYPISGAISNASGVIDTVKGEDTVTVPAPSEPTTITVEPETATLYVGDTQQFTATAYDQYGAEMPDIVFAWSSSDETAGTVDATGLFTVLAVGTTTITATNGTVSGTADVTVDLAPTPTPTPPRPRGGGKAPDSDGDGYSDSYETRMDTDPNDPSSYPGARVVTPTTPAVITPTPTPSPTPTAAPHITTPTPTPTEEPTPTPTEPPGFEAVFAIAGLLAVAYLVVRRKKR